jgi:ectoine hydroxylase-related dioxygenase (phytanoyl-CoA dioxygenase family)
VRRAHRRSRLPRDGRRPRRIAPSDERPAVREFAYDQRLRSLASDAEPFRATLFHKTSRSNWLIPWHQDTALPLTHRIDDAEWGPWSNKNGFLYAHAPEWALRQILALRVELDGSHALNGPLRVIPGTHHQLLSDAQVESIAARQADRAVDCLSPKGGVIAMRPLVVHASSKIVNDQPRRVLHIEYAAPSRHMRDAIELAVC